MNLKKKHDRMNHSNRGGHHCSDWDGLYICDDCPEKECCSCLDALAGLHPSIQEMLTRPICPYCATPTEEDEYGTHCPNCHWIREK